MADRLDAHHGRSSASLRVSPHWLEHPALYVNFQCSDPPMYALALYCRRTGDYGGGYRNWLRPDFYVTAGDALALCVAVVAGHQGAWLGLVDWLLDYGPDDWKPHLAEFADKEFLLEGAVP